MSIGNDMVNSVGNFVNTARAAGDRLATPVKQGDVPVVSELYQTITNKYANASDTMKVLIDPNTNAQTKNLLDIQKKFRDLRDVDLRKLMEDPVLNFKHNKEMGINMAMLTAVQKIFTMKLNQSKSMMAEMLR